MSYIFNVNFWVDPNIVDKWMCSETYLLPSGLTNVEHILRIVIIAIWPRNAFMHLISFIINFSVVVVVANSGELRRVR